MRLILYYFQLFPCESHCLGHKTVKKLLNKWQIISFKNPDDFKSRGKIVRIRCCLHCSYLLLQNYVILYTEPVGRKWKGVLMTKLDIRCLSSIAAQGLMVPPHPNDSLKLLQLQRFSCHILGGYTLTNFRWLCNNSKFWFSKNTT
jgi:hypothetical protein